MSQSPYTIGSPLSSPDGTSRSSGLEDESGQVSLERKLRRELRKRQREQKHLEIEMELEKQAEERRKERSATLKKIEEGEEMEEVQFQEWAKKIKQLQEDGDRERQRFERELEEEILKTRKAREERRRSSSVLVASSDPLKSPRRGSVDLLSSKSPRSKLESSETINSINETNESLPRAEVISSSSLTSEPQFVDTRENNENKVLSGSVENADGVFAESGDDCGSPMSSTKTIDGGEIENSAHYKNIGENVIAQVYAQGESSATSPVTEIKDTNVKVPENRLDSDLEVGKINENEKLIVGERDSGVHDIPREELDTKDLSKEDDTASLPRLKSKTLNSNPSPIDNKHSGSSLIDEYEKAPKLSTDSVMKEKIEETEEKGNLPNTPGRLNVKDLKEKENDIAPPFPKPESPRKKTSLFTAMIGETGKNHGSEGSSKPLVGKQSNSIMQVATTAVTETVTSTEVQTIGEKGAETTRAEIEKIGVEIPAGDEGHENPKMDVYKKGDLPKNPGKLNVKEFFKEKESNTPTPLKPEPRRKKISLVATVFEDLQKKSESNSKPPDLPSGKKFGDSHLSFASTTISSECPKDKGVTKTEPNSIPKTSDVSGTKSQVNASGDESAKPQVNRKAVLNRLPWMTQKSDDVGSTSATKGPVPRKLASSFLTPTSNASTTTSEQSKPRAPSKLDNSISQRLEGAFGGKIPLPGMGRGIAVLGGRKVGLSGDDSGSTERVKVMMGAGNETVSKDVKDETARSEEVPVNLPTLHKSLNHVTKDRPRPPGKSRPPTRPARTLINKNKESEKLDSTEVKSVTECKDEKIPERIESKNRESVEKTNVQIPETIKVKETQEENNNNIDDKLDDKD